MRFLAFSALAFFGVLAFISFPRSARADDGLRCGEWLVSAGVSQAEVAAKCGAPTRTDTLHEHVRTRYGARSCTVDLWTYDRGPHDFVRTLAFKDGVLDDVEVGGYGTP